MIAALDPDFLVEYLRGERPVSEYVERYLATSGLEDACAGYPGLAARCQEHLRTAFAQLEAIPRSDPFWRGSNMRTTMTKLNALYQERAPAASGAFGWPGMAVGLSVGNLDTYERAAEELARRDELGVAQLVRTAYNMSARSGWDTDELLARLLQRLGRVAAAREPLAQLAAGDDANLAAWAAKVLARLEQT